MNKMEEVAKLLDVKLGEGFEIKDMRCNPYTLTENGLRSSISSNCYSTLTLLLIGEYIIERKPFKPQYGEAYYSVNEKGNIDDCDWYDECEDYYFYNANNCFRTKEEITDEDIERIVTEMKGKYEND